MERSFGYIRLWQHPQHCGVAQKHMKVCQRVGSPKAGTFDCWHRWRQPCVAMCMHWAMWASQVGAWQAGYMLRGSFMSHSAFMMKAACGRLCCTGWSGSIAGATSCQAVPPRRGKVTFQGWLVGGAEGTTDAVKSVLQHSGVWNRDEHMHCATACDASASRG